MGIGFIEIFIVVFIIFLLLGPGRITGLLKSAGRAAKDFTDELGKPKKDEELPDETREKDDPKNLR